MRAILSFIITIFKYIRGVKTLTNDFPNAKKKAMKVVHLLNKYDFGDVSKAVFCIGECRNNRSVLEIIMALNWALLLHSHMGVKPIKTYAEFSAFFSSLNRFFSASVYDDVVVEDYGEVSIDVYGGKYSVVIGTGYSMVFACLQLLPYLASELHKEDELVKVLSYNSHIIEFLKEDNVEDGKTEPRFVLPSERLFYKVFELFNSFDYDELNEVSAIIDSDLIEKKHFICDDGIVPIANSSLLLDLYDKWYRLLNEERKRIFINTTLSRLALSLSKSEMKTGYSLLCPATYFEKLENDRLAIKFSFVAVAQKGIVIAINSDDYSDKELKDLIRDCQELRDRNALKLIELISRNNDGQHKVVSITNDINIEFIIYNSWTNPEEPHCLKIERNDDFHVCSGLDVVYYLLFMDDVDELYEYLEYSGSKRKNDTHILCFGGDATTFLMWKEADHMFEKGAISYGLINLGFDTENEYVVDYYRSKLKCFPIGRGDYVLDNPFAWRIEEKENGFYEYVQKGHVGFGGLFRSFDNGCYFFFSHNAMFYKDFDDYLKHKDVIGVMDEIIQRIMMNCEGIIRANQSIKYSSFQIMMMPESYANSIESTEKLLAQERQYIKSDSYITNGKIIIRYIPMVDRILEALSAANNRTVEVDVFLELMLPLNIYFPSFYEELKIYLNTVKLEKKVVSINAYELDYAWNQEQEAHFKVDKKYYLEVKKHIAEVCQNAGIEPGAYYGKDATTVVRLIQKKLIEDFENEIRQFNYLGLYERSLSNYAYLIHEVMLHRKRYDGCDEVNELYRMQIKERIIKEREEAKHNSKVTLYLLETTLFLSQKGNARLTDERYQYLLAYANWLFVLSEKADMCYFTEDEVYINVSVEYVVDVESKRDSSTELGSELAKRMYDDPGHLNRKPEVDRDNFDKVQVAYEKDTGVPLKVFIALLYYLETGGKIDDNVFYRGNTLCFFKDDIIEDFCKIQNCSLDIAYSALELLLINTSCLKTKNGKADFYLPIGEKEKRRDRFDVNPIYEYDDMIIYSPSVMHYLREYWENCIYEFHLPYEIGMQNTKDALLKWKKTYEKSIVYDLKETFEREGFIVRTNLELMKLNKHKYPQVLGDYDVFAVNLTKHEIWIVECKVIEKVETFYEMYRQQNRFFFEERDDERFQRRIDYMNENYRDVVLDLNIPLVDYVVKPYMCVNKVFVSRYKEIHFPILSYQELVNLIIQGA